MMTDLFRHVSAVFRRELSSLLGSAAAWVFLVIFLICSGFLTFIVSDILSTGQADLSPFFSWMPWLFLFVVPALAMPMWSEERKSGTLELTLSYPVNIPELVAGKFFAGLAVLIFALILTAGTPLTIAAFGKPDLNAILCGYLGAVMAGSVFLAVSCFCSAMTRSQTASFLLSLLFCALLVFTGWDKVAGYLSDHLPQAVMKFIGYAAIIPHYRAFQRGLIDTSEIAYCVLTAVLFLYLTAAALRFSSSGIGGLFLPGAMSDRYTWRRIGGTAAGIAVAFYAYFCFIYAADVMPVRFDATADQAFSLTEQSKKIASNLKTGVDVRLYLSPENSGMPSPLLQYGKRVEWLLRDFANASNGNIRLTVIRPEQDSADEEAAQLDGLEPISQTGTGDRYYLGITVSSGAKIIPLPQMTPDREVLLEYDLVRAIQNVSRKAKPLIGILSSFPVLGRQNTDPGTPKEKPLDFASELSRDYMLCEIPMDTASIPESVDKFPLSALLVFHPAGISERTQYAIDQYLMRGGKAVIFLDPRLGKKQLSDLRQNDLRAMQANLDRKQSSVDILTKAWGIDFDRESVVADMIFKFNPAPLNGVMSVQPNVLLITADGIDRKSPLTAALTRLFMVYPGAFRIERPQKNLHYETLVHSTSYAKLFPASTGPSDIFNAMASDPKAENGTPLPLVLDVTGKFRTAFPDGAPDTSALDGDRKHLSESTGSPEAVLFSDSDMLFRNATTEVRQDANGQVRKIAWNDNISLLQNVMERLCGEEDLANLRTRTPMSRPLTKIEESRRKVEEDFNEKYNSLLRDFRQVQTQAQAISRKQIIGGKRVQLTDEEKQIFRTLSRKESEFRREEKMIRNQLRTGLDAINRHARAVNILLIPGAVILLGIVWGVVRKNSRKRRRS